MQVSNLQCHAWLMKPLPSGCTPCLSKSFCQNFRADAPKLGCKKGLLHTCCDQGCHYAEGVPHPRPPLRGTEQLQIFHPVSLWVLARQLTVAAILRANCLQWSRDCMLVYVLCNVNLPTYGSLALACAIVFGFQGIPGVLCQTWGPGPTKPQPSKLCKVSGGASGVRLCSASCRDIRPMAKPVDDFFGQASKAMTSALTQPHIPRTTQAQKGA